MDIIQLLILILSGLALSGTMIGIWTSLNIKIKELDVKIMNLEEKFKSHKDESIYVIQTWEKALDKLQLKLDKIDCKLDAKMEDIAILKAKIEVTEIIKK